MGQGRNALYLAEQGWQVTGFDPAEKAVAAAQTEAKRKNLTITTEIAGSVYDTNELLSIFRDLRILRYEDVESEADFGVGQKSRVVRLAAQKPQ